MTVVINGTTGIDTGTGSLIAADATTPTYLDLFEDTDNGSNYVRLIAPTSVAANRTVTLPDGTGTVAVNNVSGVLVSGTAVASTSGTSIDFTSIPSWVKRITVMFSGVSTSGTSFVIAQLGTGGTPTTSGYGGGAWQTSTYTNVTNGMALSGNNVATDVRNGAITITNITGNTWVSTATNFNNNTTGGSGAGSVALAGVLNLVRVTTVNGTDTFDAGTINIMWE